MIVGRRYFNNDVIYTMLKKHYCPVCGTKLTRIKTSKIVNSKILENNTFEGLLSNEYPMKEYPPFDSIPYPGSGSG